MFTPTIIFDRGWQTVCINMASSRTISVLANAVTLAGVFILFMESRFEVVGVTARAIRFIGRRGPGRYFIVGASTLHYRISSQLLVT